MLHLSSVSRSIRAGRWLSFFFRLLLSSFSHLSSDIDRMRNKSDIDDEVLAQLPNDATVYEQRGSASLPLFNLILVLDVYVTWPV